MNEEKRRPYLSDRRCGRCIVPLTTEERREDGWLFVTYNCPKCGFRSVVTFSPQELEEWARRQSRPRKGQFAPDNAF
ncbi:MAG: hypothetical protein IMZ46_13125 [Acidobacteria bacterium]|nr:hypothetical protein [Acidobacteriota bacterium]